ncbi:MAG: HD domain-containing protein [Bacteriovoracaceae bacterium]|nr:HD domain-containing protein [Bacteriovoracaceae bacterium]
MPTKPSILLIVEDKKFYEKVKKSLGEENLHLHFVSTVDEAQKYLKDKQFNLNGIFINPEISNKEGVTLLKTYHENHIPVPVYLITDDLDKLSQGLTKEDMGIHGVAKSAREVTEMVKIIQIGMKEFDKARAMEVRDTLDTKDKEIQENDIAFVPIKIQNFITGQYSYFDVYIKINSNKYIKIVAAGDDFDFERIKKYNLRGTQYFYIRKNAQEHYVEFCDKLAKKVLASNKVSADMKINRTMNHGEEVLKFFAVQGLDENSLTFAKNYTTSVYELLEKVSEQNKIIKKFLKNINTYEHAIAVSILSGLMGRAYGLEAQECIEILGMAATLHDIGLSKKRTHYSEGDDLLFYEEEKIEAELKSEGLKPSREKELLEIYLGHPKRGVEMISSLKNINPTVVQIIAEHHKWNNASKDELKGFHKLEGKGMVHPLAQIVGLCDEFAKLLKLVGGQRLSRDELKTFLTSLTHYNESIGQLFIKTMTKT